jgi:hypothetical protein
MVRRIVGYKKDFVDKELVEDFMLCKAEGRDPVHCLKEGRKVTRCAIDLLERFTFTSDFD